MLSTKQILFYGSALICVSKYLVFCVKLNIGSVHIWKVHSVTSFKLQWVFLIYEVCMNLNICENCQVIYCVKFPWLKHLFSYGRNTVNNVKPRQSNCSMCRTHWKLIVCLKIFCCQKVFLCGCRDILLSCFCYRAAYCISQLCFQKWN